MQNAGWTALFFAVKEKKVEIAEKLLMAGADVHIKDAVHLYGYFIVPFTCPILLLHGKCLKHTKRGTSGGSRKGRKGGPSY